MSKKCKRCGRSFPKSTKHFHKDGYTKDGLSAWCHRCKNRSNLEWRQENKAKVQANRRAYHPVCKSRSLQLLRDAKSKPCADCGRRYPYYVMELDHRPGTRKRGCLSDLAHKGSLSAKALLREIAKCDPVCSNCHRIRTWTRMISKRSRQ